MKASLLQKMEILAERYDEIGHLLGDPDVISDQNKFRQLSKEYSEIEDVAEGYARYQSVLSDIEEAKVLLEDDDPDMRQMGEEELATAEAAKEAMTADLMQLLMRI